MAISATTTALQAAAQYMLVRVTPARYIGGSLASSGGLWQMVWDSTLPIAKIERNGTVLTADASSPGTNDHYYFDGTTLKIKLAGAPDVSTNVIVLYFRLFFTGGLARSTYETPTDNTSTSRVWEPRLLKYPKIRQGFTDILAGVVNYQASAIDLIDTDGVLKALVTSETSFYNKEVAVWLAVSADPTTAAALADTQLLFAGKARTLSWTRDSLQIGLFDDFASLDKPGYLGFPGSSFAFLQASLNSADYGAEIRAVLGSSSPASTVAVNPFSTTLPTAFLPKACRYGMRAINTQVVNFSTATTWRLGIINRSTLPVQTWGAITRTAQDTINHYTYVKVVYTNVQVGDQIAYTAGGVTKTSFVVYAGNDFTADFDGLVYNLVIANNQGTPTAFAALEAVGLWVYGSNAGGTSLGTRDSPTRVCGGTFSYAQIGTTGWYTVDLSISFSASSVTTPYPNTLGTMDATQVTLECRLSSDAMTHANAVSLLLTQAGLTVDAASITAADSALAANVQFTVPSFDATEVANYRQYVEDLMVSTLGYLRIGTSGTVEYKLLSAPSSADTRDTNTIINGRAEGELDYQDIVTGYQFVNPHLDQGLGLVIPTASSAKAKYLGGVEVLKDYRHVLQLVSGLQPRSTQIMALRSQRRVTYTFETANQDAGQVAGADLSLTHGTVLGGAGSGQIKILSVERDTKAVRMTASDLLGL